MLTTTASPLVAGMRLASPMTKITIKVTRAFLLRGERQEAGSEIEVDAATAAELVTMNKAVRAAPKVAAVEAPPLPAAKTAAKKG